VIGPRPLLATFSHIDTRLTFQLPFISTTAVYLVCAICILIFGLLRSAGDKSTQVIISAIGSDLFGFYCICWGAWAWPGVVFASYLSAKAIKRG